MIESKFALPGGAHNLFDDDDDYDIEQEAILLPASELAPIPFGPIRNTTPTACVTFAQYNYQIEISRQPSAATQSVGFFSIECTNPRMLFRVCVFCISPSAPSSSCNMSAANAKVIGRHCRPCRFGSVTGGRSRHESACLLNAQKRGGGLHVQKKPHIAILWPIATA